MLETIVKAIADNGNLSTLICMFGWALAFMENRRLTGIIEKNTERLSNMSEILVVLKERIK